MKKLLNIRKSLNELAIRLAANIELQKLLLVDDYDIQTSDFQPLTIQDMLNKHYICVGPQNEEGIEKNGRNSFLILTLQDINLRGRENNIAVTGKIFIVSDINHALMSNYQDKNLAIADTIIESIDGLKLSASVKIQADFVSRISYTETLSGYVLSFSFLDQNSAEKVEI